MLVFGWNPRTRRKTSHSWAEKGTLQQTRSHITESFLVCNYNRAKQEFCTCSTVFGTFLLPSWDEYDVEFHFYQRSQHKSTTFFSFFWTDLKTDNPFCGMKQWMVVIGNGNFYPWQNRLLIYPFMLRIAVNNGRVRKISRDLNQNLAHSQTLTSFLKIIPRSGLHFTSSHPLTRTLYFWLPNTGLFNTWFLYLDFKALCIFNN